MNPYNRPASSAPGGAGAGSNTSGPGANPSRPTNGGSAATSPNVSTGQAKPAATSASGSGSGMGNGLRPSYGHIADREREIQREIASKPFSYSGTSILPRPTDNSASSSSASNHAHSHSHNVPHHHHHHHHHHPSSGTPGSTGQPSSSSATEQRPSPYSAATPGNSGTGAKPATRKPDPAIGIGAFGRLGSGYGLFGSSFREAEVRERERIERLQRERDAKAAPTTTEKSPTVRTNQPTSTINPYARPSLPPSPTASRTLPPPASASSAGKPSVSPQPPPASAGPASSSSSRPNLPLPGYNSLGSRSLPSPFDRDGRERSTSISVAPSPGTGAPQDASASGHRRTPSGSSTRGPETAPGLGGVGQTSPNRPTAQLGSSSRSVFGAPPPLSSVNRDRDPVSSAAARAPTSASPRDRESVISPPVGQQAKPAASATASTSSTAQASAAARTPYSSYSSFGGGPAYPGPFHGFGLGGFGGYGAFGPRWDRDREREREQREQREEERKKREREAAEQQREARKAREMREAREAAESRARLEKEREEREQKWLKTQEQERDRANARYNEVFQSGRQTAAPSAAAKPAQQRANVADPYRPRQSTTATSSYDKPNYNNRHIEVINQPESQSYSTAQSATAAETSGASNSVMQQVAPQREPRPYGYKAEPRDYQYTPRDKRPRMDAAVEDASVHRRTSVANKSKRRKEEEKKSPAVAAPKERDWAALTVVPKRWPEVSSSPVEQWLKTVPDLDRVVAREVYTGGEWTLAKSGATIQDHEGGVVVVRIGGGFLGKGWTIRGEVGWDESICDPGEEVICGADDDQRRIWGTDVYTDDSDIGLVLVHAGWVRWSPSGEAEKKDSEIVNVTVRVVPRLIRYVATERNGVITRSWGNGHDGASIVVERVERVQVDKKYLASRKRKARIAEWARERQLAAPITALLDEEKILHGPEDAGLVIHATGASLDPDGLKYTPEALEGWLDPYDDEEKAARTLWTHDLHFVNGADSYILHLHEDSTRSEPRLTLYKPVQPQPQSPPIIKPGLVDRKLNEVLRAEEIIFEDRPTSDVHFLPDGLAVRISGSKGILCPVKVFRWEQDVRHRPWLLEMEIEDPERGLIFNTGVLEESDEEMDMKSEPEPEPEAGEAGDFINGAGTVMAAA